MAAERTKGPSSWLQGLGFAVTLLVGVIAGGTVGYMAIQGWGLWDAFYMTVITVTTVGYKEVHDLSRAGQVFTVVLLFGGVGAALYTVTLVASTLVEGHLPKRLQRQRREHMLEKICDHFILCGYGRIGRLVAGQLQRQRIPLVIVEKDPVRAQMALDAGLLAVEGEASREDVLKRAGIDRARGLIAVVGTDAENVYAVLSARELRSDLFIIGCAESEDSTRKVQLAGANRVISPYEIGASEIAQTALKGLIAEGRS